MMTRHRRRSPRALSAIAASVNASMSAAMTGAAPAFAAAIATRPEPAARSSTRLPATIAGIVEHVARERLSARPGEGPVGRRQADCAELLLGLLPDRHRLVGDVQRNLRHVRHRLEPRVGADEGFAVGDHAGIAALAEILRSDGDSVYARHQARPRSRRSLQAAHVRHLQDRRAPPDVLARGHRGAQLVRRAMHRGRPRHHHRRHRQHSGKEQGDGRKALSGSHLESQNHAGWLDGALGCVYALEASRAIKEAGGDAGVDVVVFCDEEGHFGSFLGSKSFTGLLQRRGHRQGEEQDTTARRCAMRCTKAGYAGRPRVDDRAGALQGVLRGAYRAGRHAGERGAAHRRRHGDRGDLAVRASR